MSAPTADDARRVAAAALGEDVLGARRFQTGLHHFVYDVELENGRSVVMRMTRPSERQVMRNAVLLSQQLLPLGVPLPALLGADLEAAFPWMLLERLPGVDLGAVIGSLEDADLRQIANGVAAAQTVVAGRPSGGRFGYSATPVAAPFERWSDVVARHVQRSRVRIAAAGLFHLDAVGRLDSLLTPLRGDLDAVSATPFLHDTTTKNVIVADGRLSGIVDVDDLCFGDPRYVAALTHVALTAHELPTDYAAHLMKAAGWDDDHLFRLYVAAFLLDFMSEHGQRFNDNERPSDADDRRKLLTLYNQALSDL